MFRLAQILPDGAAFERIFGSAATLAADSAANVASVAALTDTVVYRLALLLLFVGYAFFLIVYGGEIGITSKLVFGKNISQNIADNDNRNFRKAIRYCCTWGVLAMVVAATKLLETNGMAMPAEPNAQWFAPMVLVAVYAVFALATAIALGVGALTERTEFTKALLTISSTIFALFFVISTPLTLIFALNATTLSVIVCAVFVVLAVLAAALFGLKTLIFFGEQKISILFCFLYLCAVVVLPIGSLMTIILRAGIAR